MYPACVRKSVVCKRVYLFLSGDTLEYKRTVRVRREASAENQLLFELMLRLPVMDKTMTVLDDAGGVLGE